MHGGETISRPLSMTDNILMCSENWTELLRSDIRDRFVFTSCVLWTNKGFERSSWTNLVQGHLTGGTSTAMETKGIFINHTYFLYLDLFNFYENNFSSSNVTLHTVSTVPKKWKQEFCAGNQYWTSWDSENLHFAWETNIKPREILKTFILRGKQVLNLVRFWSHLIWILVTLLLLLIALSIKLMIKIFIIL